MVVKFLEIILRRVLTGFVGRRIVRFFAASVAVERTGKYITVGLIFRGFEKSFD